MLFLVLLVASLAGAVTATVLTVRGLVAVFRRNGRSGPGRLRAAALLAGAGAVAMYTWGMLHVGYAVMEAEDGGTGSFPIEPCRDAGTQLASRVDGYGVSFLPIHFECHLNSGGTYVTSSVPGYVNPAMAVLGLITAACAIPATTAKRAHLPASYTVDRKQ
jgi:hypothetical protein